MPKPFLNHSNRVGGTVADKTGRVAYLVDMAKAEVLDALGENRAAVELIERHLQA